MGLAVHAQQASIGIGHAQGVEVGIARLLEPAQRQYHAQLPGQRREALEDTAVSIFFGQRQVLMALFDAEIRRGKQLLQQDDLGALGRRLTHQLLSLIKVVWQVPGAGHLGGRNRQ
ncbi:hypothetical protein D3C80_1869110 [compost metagenome]